MLEVDLCMARDLKYHPHGEVLFITSSTEVGLLFLCNPLCTAILKSCLTAALAKYKVRLCHYMIEPNHFHIIIVVEDPEDVPNFIKYFKAESAHRINRVLGRKKRTVWCEGYDSPIVLTPLRALVAIAYLYANPAKDGLTYNIDEYEGVNSWRMFTTGNLSEENKLIPRDEFTYLPTSNQNERGYAIEAARVLATTEQKETLTIEPNAWLETYGITDPKEQLKWNSKVVERVRKLEERAEKARKRTGRRPIGTHRLRNQKFDLTRESSRSGKRMNCLSEKRSERVKFMQFFRQKMYEAREVVRRWAKGDFSVPYPPGFHAPCMPRLANMMP
jgi:hypothetical protein